MITNKESILEAQSEDEQSQQQPSQQQESQQHPQLQLQIQQLQAQLFQLQQQLNTPTVQGISKEIIETFDKETIEIDKDNQKRRGISIARMERRFDKQTPKFSINDRVVVKIKQQPGKKKRHLLTPLYNNPSTITNINNTIATLKPEDGAKEFKIKLSFLKKIDKSINIPTTEQPKEKPKEINTKKQQKVKEKKKGTKRKRLEYKQKLTEVEEEEETTSIDDEELEAEKSTTIKKWTIQTRKRPRTAFLFDD
jgi:hypothetical protein